MAKKTIGPGDDGLYSFIFQDEQGWYYREITGKHHGPYATSKLAAEALREYMLFIQAVDVGNANRKTVQDVIEQMRKSATKIRKLPVPSDSPSALLPPAPPVYGMLDPAKKTDARLKFEEDMAARVIDQERAIRYLSRVFTIAEAGVSDPDRPLANLLFLGPTGVGKTRSVEAMAESLFGTRQAMTKINCAEFQQHHEIAKILGAPPGYVGFREAKPLISKESLEAGWAPGKPHISMLLFDEVEKAAPEMWQLLLGMMDKGELTMGSSEIVNLARCVIVLTGNVGTTEMSSILSGGLGFSSGTRTDDVTQDDQLYHAAMAAAKKRFPPEFMNRIDKTIVFRTLTKEGLDKILDIEVNRIWKRVTRGTSAQTVLDLMPEARALLLKEGTDPKFGARPLRRTVERYLLYPLATFITTTQLYDQCILTVNKEADSDKLQFSQAEIPRIERLARKEDPSA